MPGLYKRGDVWWYQWRGKRKTTGCTDRKAAEAEFAKAQRRAADPQAQAADDATLGEWTRELFRAKASRPAGTQHMYRYKAGHLNRVLGEDAPLATIAAKVDGYVATRRAEKAADASIGKELTALTQLLKLAKRAGVWSGDLSTLRPPDFSGKSVARTRVLAEGDQEALRAACSPEQWAAVCFILATGSRLGEAMRARPGDADWQRLEITIRATKTHKGIVTLVQIPIVERCGMADRLREAVPFLPIRWAHMSERLPDVCRRAKIGPLTPNDLRRTACTRLIASGVDAYTVAKITRHATLAMLKAVYDQTTVAATRALIDGVKPASMSEPARIDAPARAPRGAGPRRRRVRPHATAQNGKRSPL
jgi:integrase